MLRFKKDIMANQIHIVALNKSLRLSEDQEIRIFINIDFLKMEIIDRANYVKIKHKVVDILYDFSSCLFYKF
jgi:hypothetical protein